MTKTATDGNILTIANKPDEEKERCEWAHSVTSTPEAVAYWEEVPYSRYEEWEKTHPEPEPEPDNTENDDNDDND